MKPAFTLPSPETGTTYSIYVRTPKGSGPWPTMIFMDGDFVFGAAKPGLAAPPAADDVLIVGVGYGAGFGSPANKRGRDYTPVAHSDEPGSGSADALLKFLTTKLWPELARRYAVDADRRGVGGHSLGSLLVLHALFQPRPFFTHFLASAPSIWWADRAILAQAAALRRHQATLPGKLFLSVGEDDSASMTGDLALLEKQLAARPFRDLEIVRHHFPHRDHYNVVPDAFSAGLAALFGH